MLIGQSRFDASQSSTFKYALRHEHAKTIIVEFAPDGNGASGGTVALYLGEQSGAPPYFTTSAKTLRFYPSPDCEYVTLVPSTGAKGLVTVSMSQRELGIGICPFDSSGSGGGGSTALAYDKAVLAVKSITHYWPMNDPAGSAVAADAAGSTPLTFVGNYTLGFPGIINDGETCAYFAENEVTAQNSAYVLVPTSAYPAKPFTFQLLVDGIESHTTNQFLFDWGQSGFDTIALFRNNGWIFTGANMGNTFVSSGIYGPTLVTVVSDTAKTFLYFNRQLAMANFNPTLVNNSIPFSIMARSTDSSTLTWGRLSKVALYSAALQQSDVNSLCAAAGL